MTSETKLKYQVFLNDFDECDLSSYSMQERNAFRWVFEPISDERNFIPLYAKINYSGAKVVCKGFALSMYNEKDNAKKRFAELIADKPNSYKKIGTHLSNGLLKTSDGMSNEYDSTGHFSLFEFENVDLRDSFEIVEQMEYD